MGQEQTEPPAGRCLLVAISGRLASERGEGNPGYCGCANVSEAARAKTPCLLYAQRLAAPFNLVGTLQTAESKLKQVGGKALAQLASFELRVLNQTLQRFAITLLHGYTPALTLNLSKLRERYGSVTEGTAPFGPRLPRRSIQARIAFEIARSSSGPEAGAR